jgi:hypothetical protein
MMPSVDSNPSISTSSWFSVFLNAHEPQQEVSGDEPPGPFVRIEELVQNSAVYIRRHSPRVGLE